MVHAVETSLKELLEGTKQYLVPLYQRTYSWRVAQLQRLWDDVLKLAEDRAAGAADATHFIGSLVLAPAPSNGPTGVQQYLVVDGQQRLTTLSLLLCAVRDYRAEFEDPMHRDRINEQYLINKWKQGLLRPKLLPTQTDRGSYLACLQSTPQAGAADGVGAAYRFFRGQLEAFDDPDDLHDIERIEEAIISGLSVVSVTAQAGDNVHRIFESLNNTGLRLTQGDLLRNYLFMRLTTSAETIYETLWLPLQQQLSSDELETLFWLDLAQQDPRVKQADTYARQQARLDRLTDEAKIEAEIERFAHLGDLFATILHPDREKDPDVRRGLLRLGAWGTTTVYPLLLNLLDRRSQGGTDSASIARAMRYVEAYLVRRLILGRATANINRVLLEATTQVTAERPADEAVRAYLSTGRKYYATDRELREAVETQPFYWNGKAPQKALVLRWLEESHGSKEPVGADKLTIEHVLPQTMNPDWEQALASQLGDDEDVHAVHAALVHTLGNLTLTGYNATLSNSKFEVKRAKLATSGLMMNQEIAAHDVWGRPEILGRSQALADRIIELWPGPLDPSEPQPSATWKTMSLALAELPAGSWTTYGDVAALIGSHPVPVGARLSSHPLPNAHRVLQVNGTLSPGFRWLEPDRSDDPLQLLKAEGVVFDADGHADPAQRFTAEELATLIGLNTDTPTPEPSSSPSPQHGTSDQFLEQLRQANPPQIVHAITEFLDDWEKAGGSLDYGWGAQTSCFLVARLADGTHDALWPAAIYPTSRKVEIVFQHLANRPPFDNPAMRESLRSRLNHAHGIDLPASKLQMRPAFPLDCLADPSQRRTIFDSLVWCIEASSGDHPELSAIPPAPITRIASSAQSISAAAEQQSQDPAPLTLATQPASDETVDRPSPERAFHAAMVDVYRRAKAEAGYNATLFLSMVSERGGLDTARTLLHAPNASDGFTALWERGRLDLSVEAVVLDPRFEALFTDDERELARLRLLKYGYTTS